MPKTRHYKPKQEKKIIETDIQRSQILELANKDFKRNMINIFLMEEEMEKIHEKMYIFIRDLEYKNTLKF